MGLHVNANKLPIYLRHGVGHAWVVHPGYQLVTVYEKAELWRLVGDWGERDRARVAPFDAIEIDLSAWWVPEDAAP